MFQFDKILVPIDFSDASEAMAEHAEALSQRLDSAVLLVHVLPKPHGEIGGRKIPQYTEKGWISDDALEAHARQHLHQVAVRMKDHAETLVVHGSPAESVLELVAERDIDLIMTPTRGTGPFRRYLIGSVTAKILHDAPCPVYTGRHIGEDHQPPPSYRKIACAVDLGPRTEAVLAWAKEFSEAWDGTMSVIHVVPSPGVNLFYGDLMVAEPSSELLKVARDRLEELTAEIPAELIVTVGDPIQDVPRLAVQNGTDVLVIGRSLEEGLLGRLRTHSYGLIRESETPVVSV